MLSPETIGDRQILVVWALGSDARVHRAPRTIEKGSDYRPFIRIGSETIEARGAYERQLLDLTAKIPFDDRRALEASVEDIREARVREYLHDTRSGLTHETDAMSIYGKMRLVTRVNAHHVPRNIALMFFSDDPNDWFRGARIEIVQFAADVSGNAIEEKPFTGPLDHQLRDALRYLRGFSTAHLQKHVDRPETKGWVSYPMPALEEAMADNGSPPPRFDFDDARTYFRCILPAHPEYLAISALRDAAHLRAIGEDDAATARLQSVFFNRPDSDVLASELIATHARNGNPDAARSVYETFVAAASPHSAIAVHLAFAQALLDADEIEEARLVLARLPLNIAPESAIKAAIAERRAGRQKEAHRYFERAGDHVLSDPRALHEFAQTKLKLAAHIRRNSKASRFDRDASLKLLRGARDMLERVVQLDAPPMRKAWAWFDLGRTRRDLDEPRHAVLEAYEEASNLLPNEARFREAIENFEQNGRRSS